MKNDIHLKPWLSDFKKYRNIKKLERNIVVSLIDKIIVHGKNEISVRFKYQDQIQEMLKLADLVASEEEVIA